MFIKEREYLVKLEMAIDTFDTWADEESKKEPMIVTGLMSQGS